MAIISIKEEKVPISLENYNSTNFNETDQPIIYKKKYDLSEPIVAQILASYFYGYTIFQLPAGRLSEIFGAKWILGLGTLISGLLAFLSPFILDLNPIALIIARIIIGSFQATILSCSYTLFAEWLPKKQKVNAITLANVGFEIGGICSFFFTGLICEKEYLGWRYSFYIFSMISFIWFIPYCFMVYSTPEDDPYLTDYERKLIENERIIEYENQDLKDKNMIKIPPKLDYKILFTSKPVIASW